MSGFPLPSTLALAVCMVLPAMACGSDTVLFNESAARECYQAALRGGDEYDIDICTKALDYQPLSVMDRAATYSNRGLIYARIGDLRSALADHDRAVSIAPDVSSVYINRSNAFVRARRYESAMRDLEKAIEIADQHLAYAHYNRALLFQRLGDGRAARADAERAAAIEPEHEAYQEFLRQLEALTGRELNKQ